MAYGTRCYEDKTYLSILKRNLEDGICYAEKDILELEQMNNPLNSGKLKKLQEAINYYERELERVTVKLQRMEKQHGRQS